MLSSNFEGISFVVPRCLGLVKLTLLTLLDDGIIIVYF